MKIIVCCFTFTVLFSCGQKKPSSVKSGYDSVDLKDITGSFKYLDSLDVYTNCEIGESEYKRQKETLNDSINFYYTQLGKRLCIANKKNISPSKEDVFIESIRKSKTLFDSLFEQDQKMLFYSYGGATGAGYYKKCFNIYSLRKRLVFIQSIVSNSYWNYGFDTLENKK